MRTSVPKENAMKANGRVACGGLLILAALSVLSCTKSATTGGAASSSASMMSTGMNLVNALGGMDGVTKLADAFGLNLAANPITSKLLDAATIAQTKLGLVNEIAKASGMAVPNPGVDLVSTLSGKGIDASAASAMTSALSSAADAVKLAGPAKDALVGLFTPIANSLVGK
jgi:hypothetical protein